MSSSKQTINELKKPPSIKIEHLFSTCYSLAWKAFAKWWIPLCLIAAFLLFFEALPRFISIFSNSDFWTNIQHEIQQILIGIENQDQKLIFIATEQLQTTLYHYSFSFIKISLYLLPFVTILSVLLMATSIMAVQNKQKKYPILHLLKIALASLFLSIIRVFFLLFILPLGLFLYIKLYFVSLYMLEENQGIIEAIKSSWKLSKGYFWTLFAISITNNLIQLFISSTIIGLIPSTGFIRTVRSEAFELLKKSTS